MPSTSGYDLTVKIILLGDFNVNKGEILRALGSIQEGPAACTMGMRAGGLVEMMFVRDGKRVRAKIHETAGQERYRSITSSFYRGAHGCLLLFDVMLRSTFENLNEWQQELSAHSITDEIVTTLTGCNSHITGSKRQVDSRTGHEFASYLGIPYEEISVQNVSTIVHVMEKLIDRIMLKASRLPNFSSTIRPYDHILEDLQQQNRQKRSGCVCRQF